MSESTTGLQVPVTVAGSAQVRALRPELSLPELIFQVISSALADAGLGMEAVDGIVIAAHDLIDGRSLSSMITGPAAGAYLRDEIRVSDDGLVALSLGAARLRAGEGETVVVAAWGRASEGDPVRTSRVAFDPFTEQPLGLHDEAVAALRASAYLRQYGEGRREDAVDARARRAGVSDDPRDAHEAAAPLPLTRGEASRPADVAAAAVLRLGEHGPRLVGFGHGTDRRLIGDRELTDLAAARDAVHAALGEAGIGVDDVDLVEVAAATLTEEVLMLEAAGLAEPGTGFGVYADQPWISPSGVSARGTCPPCTGLLSFVEAVQQLRGTAPVQQVQPRPSRALVLSGSTVALQTVAAVVLEAP